MKLRTLDMIPTLAGRRFGMLEIGTSNVEVVREEHQLLANVASVVIGVPASDITLEQLRGLNLDQIREALHAAPTQ